MCDRRYRWTARGLLRMRLWLMGSLLLFAAGGRAEPAPPSLAAGGRAEPDPPRLERAVVLFPVSERTTQVSPGVQWDVASGRFRLVGTTKTQTAQVVYRCAAGVVWLDWLPPERGAAELVLATSTDGQTWGDGFRWREPGGDVPFGPVTLRDVAGRQFIRLSAEAGPGTLLLGLRAAGLRTSQADSGPLEVPAGTGDRWLSASYVAAPGTPPETTTVSWQPPLVKRAEPRPTGTLAAGSYTYVVKPYAEGSTAAEPAMAFIATTGEGGRVTLDWRGRETALAAFFGASTDEPKPEAKDEEIEGLVRKPKPRGFRIWRRDTEAFQLVAELANDQARQWADTGVAPRAGPALKEVPEPAIAAEAENGSLPPGDCWYRLAAVLPGGLTEAGPPVKVTLNQGEGAVRLRLAPVVGALGYLVWRSRAADQWADSLVARLAADEWYWTDTGFPTSTGTTLTVEYRVAASQEGLAAAAWAPLVAGTPVHLAEPVRWLQCRAVGKTDFLWQNELPVRLLVTAAASAKVAP